MVDPHLAVLLDRYFDRSIDEADLAVLEATLSSCREARAEYWRRAHFEEALSSSSRDQWGSDARLVPFQDNVAPRKPRPQWRWLAGIGIAAAVVAGLWLGMREPRQAAPVPVAGAPEKLPAHEHLETAPPAPASDPAPKVAMVERSLGAKWADRKGRSEGFQIGTGSLVLEEGVSVLRLFGGARLNVQGPTEVTLFGENAVGITRGSLEIEVPEVASGFRISVGESMLSATEGAFEITREATATTGIYIHSGSVTLAKREERPGLTAHAGSYLVLDRAGTARLGAPPSRVRSRLTDRVFQNGRERLEVWREASRNRSRDPGLLVHFRMDEPSMNSGVLLNSSSHPAANRQGTIISADVVEGRWPGKRALSFHTDTGRARIAIAGTYPQVTFAAWVRIDAPTRPFNALFMSEGERPGVAHWQISSDAEFRFSIQPAQPLPGLIFLRAHSPPVISDEERGSWKLLVSTCDSSTQTAVNYVDGKEISRATLSQSVPVVFGVSTLGNRSWPIHDYWGSRSFGGAIDEFLLYERVLSQDEISALYQEGRSD